MHVKKSLQVLGGKDGKKKTDRTLWQNDELLFTIIFMYSQMNLKMSPETLFFNVVSKIKILYWNEIVSPNILLHLSQV